MKPWMQFFEEFFNQNHENIGIIINAYGCREGWLQGEFYRQGINRDLKVNEFSLGNSKKTKKADLYSPQKPQMIAEIKIIGTDFQNKMRSGLENDIDRLNSVKNAQIEKYMILVIPEPDNLSNTLGKYLNTVNFSNECFEKVYSTFKLRIWEL